MASSSAALTLLCSSFASHCKISPPSISQFSSNLPSLSFSSSSSSSSHKFLSSSSSSRFLIVPKSSETDSTVLKATEPVPSEPEPAASEAAESPKREEIFVVVTIGGRQYIVIPGLAAVAVDLLVASPN